MKDITCRRAPDGTAECSIEHRHKHHSPTGFEFSYGGSGPADLALNILALFIGPAPDPGAEPDEEADPDAWEQWAELHGQGVALWDGTRVHVNAWDWHQAFKWECVATMPQEGGTIPWGVIVGWIAVQEAREKLAGEDHPDTGAGTTV